METPIEFADGAKLEIVQDEYAPNPRSDYDEFGTMVCFHSNYILGDNDHDYKKDDHNSWDELKDAIWKDNNVAMILPLYLYDHSGITISVEPFSCQWDSGQVGWIYITKEKLAETGVDFDQEKIRKLLLNEVEVYDQYLTGDVYGFILQYVKDKCETCGHTQIGEDSCYGFYGENPFESGMIDHIPERYHKELKEYYPEPATAV